MTTTSVQREFRTDEDQWRAVITRDKKADGKFFYSVKSTGIYCRPGCPARLARREQIQFHATAAEAEQAGFRACKRCRPNESGLKSRLAEAVATACRLITVSDEAPDLETLSRAVRLSPSHLHRAFKSLMGLTPKAYALAHRAERTRQELRRSPSVTSAIYGAGFNSNSRFYATSSKMLGMKPAAFRAGGTGARIQFAVGQCSLGSILVAATPQGICYIMLGDDPNELVKNLRDRFPRAELFPGNHEFEETVAAVVSFVERPAAGLDLPLDVQGTAFQQRVWQKLCEIPFGKTSTYADVAKAIGRPKATRAVAQACGANPIAVAIPCHRVVRSDGSLSGYRWGVERKAKLLEREQKRR